MIEAEELGAQLSVEGFLIESIESLPDMLVITIYAPGQNNSSLIRRWICLTPYRIVELSAQCDPYISRLDKVLILHDYDYILDGINVGKFNKMDILLEEGRVSILYKQGFVHNSTISMLGA